jgi:DNA polymerase III delta prime subunit
MKNEFLLSFREISKEVENSKEISQELEISKENSKETVVSSPVEQPLMYLSTFMLFSHFKAKNEKFRKFLVLQQMPKEPKLTLVPKLQLNDQKQRSKEPKLILKLKLQLRKYLKNKHKRIHK